MPAQSPFGASSDVVANSRFTDWKFENLSYDSLKTLDADSPILASTNVLVPKDLEEPLSPSNIVRLQAALQKEFGIVLEPVLQRFARSEGIHPHNQWEFEGFYFNRIAARMLRNASQMPIAKISFFDNGSLTFGKGILGLGRSPYVLNLSIKKIYEQFVDYRKRIHLRSKKIEPQSQSELKAETQLAKTGESHTENNQSEIVETIDSLNPYFWEYGRTALKFIPVDLESEPIDSKLEDELDFVFERQILYQIVFNWTSSLQRVSENSDTVVSGPFEESARAKITEKILDTMAAFPARPVNIRYNNFANTVEIYLYDAFTRAWKESSVEKIVLNELDLDLE